jgi:mannan endo-1,4-beta-mannosidase
MKKFLLFLVTILLFSVLPAQPSATIHTSGRYIIGNCGDTLMLKGINYAPYNWGYSSNQLRIDQIAMTGANSVRLPWYASGNPALYADYVYLDSAISKCIQADMIPIIELHDETCKNAGGTLIELANFYTQTPILAIIQKYKHSLIVNVANEALFVNWTGNAAQATLDFQNTYSTIIDNLRTAGIDVPIMIDGPDCGTNLDALASVGLTLIANDPLQNLIFSAHSYWYAFANNDSMTYLNKINNALNANIPFVFGEVANLQDDQQMCQYVLNYKPLLSICESKKIGWLAWSWDNDGCSQRQISSTGNYANLTTYGNVIVNNPVYGTKNTAKRSRFLLSSTCSTTAIEHPKNAQNIYQIREDDEALYIQSRSNSVLEIEIYTLLGQIMLNQTLQPQQELRIAKNHVYSSMKIMHIQKGEDNYFHKYLD